MRWETTWWRRRCQSRVARGRPIRECRDGAVTSSPPCRLDSWRTCVRARHRRPSRSDCCVLSPPIYGSARPASSCIDSYGHSRISRDHPSAADSTALSWASVILVSRSHKCSLPCYVTRDTSPRMYRWYRRYRISEARCASSESPDPECQDEGYGLVLSSSSGDVTFSLAS